MVRSWRCVTPPVVDREARLVLRFAMLLCSRRLGGRLVALGLSWPLLACSEGTGEPLTGVTGLGPSGLSPTALSPTTPAVSPSNTGATETTGSSTSVPPGTSGDPTGGSPDPSTPVGQHGQLQIVGNKLHDASDEVVILRGQGLGWDNWWPQYYNADVVAWLGSDWCVDVVRPAMGIDPDGAYLSNPTASRSRIETVVDAAVAEGLYVIIDWHAHDIYQDEAVAFFTDMATKYGHLPNVIYEVFNEPEDDETWPEVKAYAETVIAAIRQHDPDNLVIVGSPEWDQRIDLVAEDPITSDSNVIYAVHFYAATHGEWLRERTADALEQGIPVIVSESSGSEASGMGDNDYTEWQAWFGFMEANSISWLNYAIADKEGETISVLEPGAPSTAGWDASHLTESGEFIRDVFRSHCE